MYRLTSGCWRTIRMLKWISSRSSPARNSDVSRGSLELKNNGSFTYTPPQDYIGTASFTYKAYDGELYSNVATVTITVGEDDEPPTISWLSPSIDEDAWIDVGTQIYPLEVKVLDNVEVAVVNFRRWEPSVGSNGDWVYLGSVSSPFRLDLDTSTINLGFNQITAEAFDSSSNFSELNIFLSEVGGLIHMPVVSLIAIDYLCIRSISTYPADLKSPGSALMEDANGVVIFIEMINRMLLNLMSFSRINKIDKWILNFRMSN